MESISRISSRHGKVENRFLIRSTGGGAYNLYLPSLFSSSYSYLKIIRCVYCERIRHLQQHLGFFVSLQIEYTFMLQVVFTRREDIKSEIVLPLLLLSPPLHSFSGITENENLWIGIHRTILAFLSTFLEYFLRREIVWKLFNKWSKLFHHHFFRIIAYLLN